MKYSTSFLSVFLALIIALMQPAVSYADDQQDDWAEAYFEYLDSFYVEDMGKSWSEIEEYYHFSMVDIAKDGVPELVMITDMQWLPCCILYLDDGKVCNYQSRYVKAFYFLLGQNLVRIEWFLKGRTFDDLLKYQRSAFELTKEGWHGTYNANGEYLEQEEFYWCDDPAAGLANVQVTEEEYRDLISKVIPEEQATVVDWNTYQYDTFDDLKDAFGQNNTVFDEKYPPYPTIALQSKSTGCYITCDIGAKKDDGKYERFDEPTLRINATQIQWYEMFNLVPISGEIYALQSEANRQYMKRDYTGFWWKGLKSEDDFVEEKNKVRMDLNSAYTTIEFIESGSWVTIENGELKWSEDRSKAEQFKIIYLDDNKYDATEKAILSSDEWFDLNGTGVGYWNVQDEIGRAETSALTRLGYSCMRFGIKNSSVIRNGQMQCAVGVKLGDDDVYDVLITFQGTGGDVYGPFEGIFDSSYSVGGHSFAEKGMHDGYISIVGLFEDIEYSLSTTINGKEIRFPDLVQKAKTGQARFMILGHSMGGAMAQIYAVKLNRRGVPTSQIRGRTFNSALALTPDEKWPEFENWYNICVSSDSVTNGLVIGSIVHYGIYRIGRTIWLYDDAPAENIDRSANIANAKHNMDQKLKEILAAFAQHAN